jgi:hypothetical protein
MNLPDSQIPHPIYQGAGTLNVSGSTFGFHGSVLFLLLILSAKKSISVARSVSEHHDTSLELPDTQFTGMIHPLLFNGSVQDDMVDDRHIVPIPGCPSLPYFSMHDENMWAGGHQLQNNFELYQRYFNPIRPMFIKLMTTSACTRLESLLIPTHRTSLHPTISHASLPPDGTSC